MSSINDSPLIQQYTKACEWIDAKPVRERALIGLSIIALVFLIWNFLFQLPQDKRSLELNAQLSQLNNERKTTQDQLTGLATAFSNNPAKVKQAEIDQLQIILRDVEEKLSGVSQSLVAAENLPRILESVFHQTQGLELISIETLAAQEMMLAQITAVETPVVQTSSSASSVGLVPDLTTPPPTPVQESKPQGSGVYKHGVVLHLRGDYFQVLALMKSLENLSWKFYWESLDYKVIDYPDAEIELRVFTLSSEEGLLGV
jgi:MSHA biogenesis protein MshJ